MTDRFFALTVVLDGNIRDDDAEPIIAAIKQLRHVKEVTPHVFSTEAAIARQQGVSKALDHMTKAIFEMRSEL